MRKGKFRYSSSRKSPPTANPTPGPVTRQETSPPCLWTLVSEEVMLGAVAAILEHEDKTKGIRGTNKNIAEFPKKPTPELTSDS